MRDRTQERCIPCLTLLLACAFLLGGLRAEEGATEPVPPRPEVVVMQRNFERDGKPVYDFPTTTVTASAVSPTASGVRITYADGHTLEVPATGEVQTIVLRNGHDEVAPGSGTFRDAIAATFLVDADPETVNRAVRDVEGYVDFFQKGRKARKTYCHTWFTDGRRLDLARHPAQQATIDTSVAAVTAALSAAGYDVATPESALIQLALVVGECKFIVKSKCNPTLTTTCYRVNEKDANGQSQLLAILNENALAWHDEEAGADLQNVVWVIEPIVGKGTLVRYVYACELTKPIANLVADERWEMAIKNVQEFAAGIRARALSLQSK